MPANPVLSFSHCTIKELTIDDEKSFRHVSLYADLKEVLRRAGHTFRVLPPKLKNRWDRALLLNLTFWGATEGDVMMSDRIMADVVTHVGWHHLAQRANGSASIDALFLGESIASAFDVYLVGRLIGHSPQSTFLDSHVAHMADTADAAGLSEADFSSMIESIASDPDRAFEDLRQLLFDASTALVQSSGAEAAMRALGAFDGHRFASLLHGYELSNWVLYARAYGQSAVKTDSAALAVDRALRDAADSLQWLTTNWVTPALG